MVSMWKQVSFYDLEVEIVENNSDNFKTEFYFATIIF